MEGWDTNFNRQQPKKKKKKKKKPGVAVDAGNAGHRHVAAPKCKRNRHRIVNTWPMGNGTQGDTARTCLLHKPEHTKKNNNQNKKNTAYRRQCQSVGHEVGHFLAPPFRKGPKSEHGETVAGGVVVVDCPRGLVKYFLLLFVFLGIIFFCISGDFSFFFWIARNLRISQ